jgi:hypothetical protein
MSQFKVISDVTTTLKDVLQGCFTDAGFKTVTVNTDVPKKENIKNKPAVNCYMYHLGFAPNYKERTRHLVSTEDKDGKIIEYYQDAPVYVYAHYITSVWGNNPAEESLLLGLVIKAFLENNILEGKQLNGESFYPDDKINIYPNLESDYSDVLTFWRSMGEEVRPALYYYVKCRIESDRKSAEVHRVGARQYAYP